jgi:DnaA family protein
MQQLLLDVKPVKKDYLAEDFLPLSSSFHAHRVALGSLCSTFLGCVIFGPVGVGKTHLINICAQYLSQNSDKIVYIDNINNLPSVDINIEYLLIDNLNEISIKQQELLFHWFNHLQSKGGKLVIATSKNIEDWANLADLRSRLLLLQQAIIELPNEKDLEIFISKQAFDKQVDLSVDVVNYLSTRSERNLAQVAELIDMLDDESLRNQRKITIPLIKQLLER